MVRDIPNPDDFFETGLAYWGFAWEILISLLKQKDEFNYGIDQYCPVKIY